MLLILFPLLFFNANGIELITVDSNSSTPYVNDNGSASCRWDYLGNHTCATFDLGMKRLSDICEEEHDDEKILSIN